MSEIEQLQNRILAAMDRIGTGLNAVSAGQSAAQAAGGDIARALDEEKTANAQLEERLSALKFRHAEEIAELRTAADESPGAEPAELEALRGQLEQQSSDMTAQAKAMAQLDDELQRLRKANEALRDANAALRAANEAGVGEPHLINKAMLAELEGLRASQAAQSAEAGAVLARITPLLATAETLTEEEDA